MKKLFVITGPAGVGKSTISRLVCDKLGKSVLIEGDDIYRLVKSGYISPWKQGNHLNLMWKNAFALIKNSLDAGFDVVFNYIITKTDVSRIKYAFSDVEIKFVVLMVDEKTIVARDKLRPVDSQMGERSVILLEDMQRQKFDEANILETSALSINKTADAVLNEKRFII